MLTPFFGGAGTDVLKYLTLFLQNQLIILPEHNT